MFLGKEEQKQKLNEVEKLLKSQSISELDAKKAQMTKEELLKQEEEFRKKEAELQQKDKLTPWNIDTICKDGFSKSIINKFVVHRFIFLLLYCYHICKKFLQ